ncbi:UvrD-helicase domain-containing protein [Paenibacillus tarimensis]
MASGISFENPFTLVNAPAGSGKTTAISKSIKQLLGTTDKRILCITFTNRATEQLAKKIEDDRVDISTIHSFISNIMLPFFKKKEIIDLYCELFKEKIIRICNSVEAKDSDRIEKYRSRMEISSEVTIDFSIIANNLCELYYNEAQFSSYLYGGLSHDDLLYFSKEVFQKYSKINMILSHKYSHIFIDEYQDTKSEILILFFNATLGTATKLVLMGDEMQQIYSDRGEEFQTTLDNNFYKDTSLNKNWRSKENIVTVLNNLYFDPKYKQVPMQTGGELPAIHIVKDINNIEVIDGALQLVLYNSDMFDYIGSGDLFRAFSEKYKIFDKYSAKQILTDMTMDNPDELMIILIFITDLVELFDQHKFGELIKKLTEFKHANGEMLRVKKHPDKVKLYEQLQELSTTLKQDISLIELLTFLRETKIINEIHVDEVMRIIYENEKFKEKIHSIEYTQFKNCYVECKRQSISTQHAVKGEGHNAIQLKISDGANPNIQMYTFLELWSRKAFNYITIKRIQNELAVLKHEYSNALGHYLSVSNINKELFEGQLVRLTSFLNDSIDTLKSNQHLYECILAEEYETFVNKQNVSNYKKCLSALNKLDGIIPAYKLFYVGCSRAMEKLNIYVLEGKISHFRDLFMERMSDTGFLVK